VAAHLASRADEQVPAFTVEFADASHNEARGAAETAKCLGMWHEVLAIDEDRLVQLAHDFVDCYEQPYADTSGLATILLCRAVRPHVTVALSGDGGDEFFAGYARYQWFQQALSAQRLPAPVRRCLRYVVRWLDQRRGDRIARLLARHDGAGLYAEILRNWTPGALSELLPEHRQAEELAESLVRDLFARLPADPLAQAACFDATYYLPDDLQVKLDRASMRVGLEVRCPLLDFRVAGLGAATATARKLRRGPKSILREVLAEHLPAPPLGRPKHGFSVPLARWLRGPLRGFAHDALNSQVFRETSWLDQALVQRLWREFQQGRQQWAHSIWMLVSVACTIRPVAVGPVHRLLKASDRRAA
jgi:asparagine synthase (glutamine-hydrolysing)